MPKKIPSPVCGFRAVHAEAVRNRWGSVKTSYITAIPIARATTHPGSSGVGFFILSCSHPAMASQRRRMTSICCSSFNPAFNNDEQRAFVARRSFIFVPQPCLQRRRMTSMCCSSFNPAFDDDERRVFVARCSFIFVPQPCLQRQRTTSICCSSFNPAFNDDERRAFVARRSFTF